MKYIRIERQLIQSIFAKFTLSVYDEAHTVYFFMPIHY